MVLKGHETNWSPTRVNQKVGNEGGWAYVVTAESSEHVDFSRGEVDSCKLQLGYFHFGSDLYATQHHNNIQQRSPSQRM